MLIRWSVIALLVLLLGCGPKTTVIDGRVVPTSTVNSIHQGEPVTLTAQQVAAVQEGMRRSLKDPDSARFGEIRAVREPGANAMTVCGYVNAKNSFGGYTGPKLFVGVLGSGVFTAIPDSGGDVDWGREQLCRLKGISF